MSGRYGAGHDSATSACAFGRRRVAESPSWYTPVPMAVGTQEDQVAPRQDDGPALSLYLSEPGRAVADYGLYLAARPLLPRLPRGDGHPGLGLPRLLADDVPTPARPATQRQRD